MEKPPSEDQDFSEHKDQDSSTAMAEEEEPGKIEYPPEKSCYKILDDIGKGENAIVHKAACLPMNSSILAIKVINVDRSRVDLKRVISHPNILQAHRSFMVDSRLLWVVMPFISSGSLESIIASSFPDGLSEPCIAIVLKEILKALLYLHEQGHLHRDIKASNILIDSDGSVKLSDFGVSASIYKPNSSQTSSPSSPSLSSLSLKDVAETPFWMAPEVIESHTGYSFKTDIWSFGITALELAHGRPPLSHFPLSKSLIMSITHRFRFFDYEKNRKDKKNFSESFKDLVISCLIADPSKRPNAEELLKHPFFKNCKNADFLVENILQDLPTIEERFKKTKQIPPPPTRSDEEENPEEGSPEVKQRRINGWKFNEEDMEFEPVFPAEKGESSSKTQEEESITKRVRFGREVIIHEFSDKDDEDPSPPIPEEHTILLSDEAQSLIEQWANEEDFESEETGSPTNIDEPEIGGHDDAGLQNPIPQQVAQGMIPSLEVLQFSLNAQLLAVSNMLAQIRGEVVEVTSEEQLLLIVQQLRVELDRERSKASALEMHLESIRRSTGLTDGSSDTTSSSGPGSSSE